MMDLTSNVTKIRSCSELAHLIIQKCAGTFFPTPIEVDPTGFLDFTNFFSIAIGDVVRQIKPFKPFLHIANCLVENQRDTSFQSALGTLQ